MIEKYTDGKGTCLIYKFIRLPLPQKHLKLFFNSSNLYLVYYFLIFFLVTCENTLTKIRTLKENRF